MASIILGYFFSGCRKALDSPTRPMVPPLRRGLGLSVIEWWFIKNSPLKKRQKHLPLFCQNQFSDKTTID